MSAQSLSVGPNVNVNRQSGYQAEEAVAIDPTNPNRLFAWANDIRTGPALTVGWSRSFGPPEIVSTRFENVTPAFVLART